MADEFTQDIGIEGGISNMVPASFVSRQAEGADLEFGQPVKQGTNDKGCVKGVAAGDFVGISVQESGIANFAEDSEARIMTQGVIWVKAAGTVTAGDPVVYASGWKTAATGLTLTDARYDTGGKSGDLVQIRLWGTNAETVS